MGTDSRKEESESVAGLNRPWEKRGQKGDAGGRPSWRSSLLGDASVEFAMENSGNGKREKKERNGLTLTGLLMEGVWNYSRCPVILPESG